ncbi:hypothetical protein TRM7557_02883 [Tritonibacter multivorans]|uniref:Lipoprotein n=1 Tax=Tritonibacter multivorans TaxID=928856 RepID=A0A0P1GG58_9RHOB|nr:hypothetical protein [Tritonibacter multivorans]MDA7420978.1 hypothetical protein [Tritonibacter multivorans]CUH80416.1 hypothetical protein TRM7557_02883 [Tritonibacter multivorans]SFC79776.1 hypothetical protein SAMN04488049_104166 [Tritonibacter multivorans]
MIRAAAISCLAVLALGACQTTGAEVSRAAPEYLGVDTFLLDGDLVQFEVAMKGVQNPQELDKYANCAAAQYTLIRGYGYARHVRTKLKQEGGIWAADAVYTISPSLPRGLRTIDATVEVADCEANGIPTV